MKEIEADIDKRMMPFLTKEATHVELVDFLKIKMVRDLDHCSELH